MRKQPRPKRRLGPGMAIDFFPFIGIIVCVIGVVVLLIGGVAAAGGIQETQADQVLSIRRKLALAERWLEGSARVGSLAAAVRDARSRLEHEDALKRQLDDARAALARARQDADNPELKRRLELATETARARAELAKLKSALAGLPEQIAAARAVAAEAAGSITIRHTSPNANVRPVYVECHAAGLTVFRLVDGRIDESSHALEQVKAGGAFAKLVAAIASPGPGPRQVINLLVRPNGVEAHDRAAALIRDADAPASSIPIVAPGKMRFHVPAAGPTTRPRESKGA
jgi:hypothetical protein